MKQHLSKRILSWLLVLALFMNFAVPVGAAHTHDAQTNSNLQSLSSTQTDGISGTPYGEPVDLTQTEEEEPYEADEIVRVSIVLEDKSTLEMGYSTQNITANAQAMAYRDALADTQAQVTARIESALDHTLDVQWNLTLAANIISANVEYGQIETIEAVPGVREVVLETRYEPCVVAEEGTVDPSMATSDEQIGSSSAYALGYTGAGTRVAVIDTGIDMDHQSFSAESFEYSLSLLAEKAGKTLEAYMAELDLLDAEEIEGVLQELNVVKRVPGLSGALLYKNSKIGFGFNYVDKDAAYIDHNQDAQGGHGSHVAGIAAANGYIATEDGSYANAFETVSTQGVAPDAQIIVMKVFGKGGGAYDADYMAAIEDAIVLGCDAVNLSLGSAAPGFAHSYIYEELLNELAKSDTVVVASAGNAGHWADQAKTGNPGKLYIEDVSMHTSGSPSTYANMLSVASVDNDGTTGYYITAGGQMMFYAETDYSNEPLRTLAGEHEYVLIDGIGTDAEFAAVADYLAGKIALCYRGTTSFFEKANNAVKYGAIGVIVCNIEDGVINMDLTGYTGTAPVVSITKADAAILRAQSAPLVSTTGATVGYIGTLTVAGTAGSTQYDSDYYTMSSFSSWGVPGDLTLKPEITAPGGSIYSVDGEIDGGTSYITMSGTSMAAPQISGMTALVAQYIEDKGLEEATGLSKRVLAQSLLMSTARALEEKEGTYYSVMNQGAGLADVGNAINANSYILMGEDATASYADGKIKAELKDDPERTGVYEFSFSLNNLTGTTQKYMLSANMFTQARSYNGQYWFLDKTTARLQADVTWTVNGTELVPAGDISGLDFNGDGLVNTDDVQALLDYATTVRSEITNADLADLNGDGAINSYDAYLLLDKLNSGVLTLAPDAKVNITVKVALTEEQKASLNANYVNGAYVEGFVLARELATEEGVLGTTHSIPVLGFYGSWTDPSMFDESQSYDEKLFGNPRPSYNGENGYINSLVVTFPDAVNVGYYFKGNPYMVEDEFPADRVTMNLNSWIGAVSFLPIRNIAYFSSFAQNAEGEFQFSSAHHNQMLSTFYNITSGSWTNLWSQAAQTFIPAIYGFEEGDTLTYSFVAIPELYETDGQLTVEQAQKLITDDVLGDGAYIQAQFKIDSKAPEMLGIYKDLETNDLIIETRDNNYVAAVQVTSPSGKIIHTTVLPEQTEPGQTTRTVLDLSDLPVGPECIVIVGDYSKNESVYTVQTGYPPVDYTGQMFGYTNSKSRGEGNRWLKIEADELWAYNQTTYGGTSMVDTMDEFDVLAAEYVDGHVYMAAADGNVYVGLQGEWAYYRHVSKWSSYAATVKDMAFNYQDNTMYMLDGNNTVYSFDIYTGAMTKVATLTITNPATTSSSYLKLGMLAIDDEGTFYLANNSSSSSSAFLYSFTLEQVVDGALTLAPVVNDKSGSIGYYTAAGSMAWDHDKDVLYMAGNASATSLTPMDKLVTIDVQTGKGTPASTADGGYGSFYASNTYIQLRGLYIVPSITGIVEDSTEAYSIFLNKTSARGLVGSVFQLDTTVYPWNLADKSVSWSSADESIATVDENGTVTIQAQGTTTITATTNAAPYLTATCTVTGEKIEGVELSGMVRDPNGDVYFADFNTADLSKMNIASPKVSGYYSGALLEGELVVHDAAAVYGLDPETFEVNNTYGDIANSWIWSDAAPFPKLLNYGPFLLGTTSDGALLTMLGLENQSLSYFEMAEVMGESEKVAAVAFVGTGNNGPWKANFYYVLTESGDLWDFAISNMYNGAFLSLAPTLVGNTGLSLEGVAAITEGPGASMYYDQNSGYLLLSLYTDGDTTRMYGINPDSALAGPIGEFPAGYHPVNSLYQYERVSELTVQINNTASSLFAGETVQLTARVLPISYRNQVTWTSSDPTVATVDENGLVTAIKGGTAIITATSVDVDEAGNPATATCTVTVKDLSSLSVSVNAQIHTADGAKWVTIDTEDQSYTVNANATTALTGAGAHNGKLYGSDSNFSSAGKMYMIDPASGYSELQGSGISYSYAILDATTGPATDVTLTAPDGTTVDTTAFGYPMFISNYGYFGMITDYFNGFISGMSISSNCPNVGALTYVGDSTYTDSSEVTHETKVFFLLSSDGTLYCLHMFPIYHATAAGNVSYSVVYQNWGNVGVTFPDHTKMTMTYVKNDTVEGLVVGATRTDEVELFFIDLANGDYSAGKLGAMEGVTGIEGLYTNIDMTGTVPNEAFAIVEGSGTRASTPFSYAQELPELETLTEMTLEADQVEGGLNEAAETAEVAPMGADSESDCGTGKTTLTLTADGASTNGIVTVEYDATKLTLEAIDSAVDFKSIVEEAGKLTFGYVNAEALTDLATLTFTVNAEATVTVTTVEENAAKPGTVQTLTLTAPAHDDQLIDSRAATCTEDGYNTYECAACGHTHTEILPALGHDLVSTVVAPTCEQDGYTLHECSRCDLSYRDSIVEATGHDYEAVVTEPTCTTAGYTTYTCASCGDTHKDDIVEATGHDWGEWTTTKEATCDEAGSRERVCAACGEKQTEDILPTGHDYTSVVIEATCHTAGYTQWTCTCCGNTYMTDLVEALGHDFSDWTETKAPTCTEKGEETRNCARCDHSETRETDALGHDYTVETVAATCTEDGYTQHTCAVCGDSYLTDLVEALGHDYAAEVVEPTCTEDGYTQYTCTLCGDSYLTDYTKAHCPSAAFTDLDVTEWYHEGVDYVLEKGLMKGMSDGIFAPKGNLTRAQLVTTLYRMAGEPNVEGMENPFTDVNENDWFADAVIWAYDAKIVNGTSDTTFAPNVAITREQIAAILYRYSGAEPVEEDHLKDFTDAAEVTPYAEDALNWAVAEGLITGMGNGKVAPTGTATRAQIATILMRYCER